MYHLNYFIMSILKAMFFLNLILLIFINEIILSYIFCYFQLGLKIIQIII